jgi:hypothetical protein
MIYTDDELSEIEGYEDEDEAPLAPPPAPAAMAPVPLYPLSLAQLGQGVPGENKVVAFAKKKVGPLPVWAWLLGAGAVGTGAYFVIRRKGSSSGEESSSVTPNSHRSSSSDGDHEESGGSGWSPSRSAFASQLQRHFDKKGQSSNVVVWHDAEDAQKKGRLKFVSPLINVQVKGGVVKVDAALQKFCRREGLNPVAHDDGSIGLYPHSGKRGKAWEDYVDALRDDGQQV